MVEAFIRIIGFLLIIIGIVIIFSSLFITYQIFWLKKPAPQIFQTSSLETQQEKKPLPQNLDPQERLRLESQETIKQAFKEVMPEQKVNELLNLVAFSIFIFILVVISGQMIFSGLKLMSISPKNE